MVFPFDEVSGRRKRLIKVEALKNLAEALI